MLVPVAEADRSGKKPATYQDVLDAPEHMVAEILDGELFLSPRPAPLHAFAWLRIGSILSPAMDEARGGPGGWSIIGEPEVHLASDVIVPDFAGWRRERMPRLPKEAYYQLAPDWVCEVLSPSTEKIDRGNKLCIYAREAVSHMWLINPVLRMLEVFRLEQGRWMRVALHEDEAIVRAEPFEAVEIELARLWGEVETAANGQAQE